MTPSLQELKNKITLLSTPKQLELFGKTFNASELFDLLTLIQHDKTAINGKLNPILAGVSHEVFFQVLPELSDMETMILQQESSTIPVQHHLTALYHEKKKTLQEIETAYLSLEMLIEHIEVEKTGIEDCDELLEKINGLKTTSESLLHLLNQALKLAWNSDRADLIENLSLLKETIQKYKLYFISDLYTEFRVKLNAVYADTDASGKTIPLLNDLPAIEALSKLSIWHLQDYFDLGLLPNNTLDSLEKIENRKTLILEAKTNLEKLNLLTLEDLKKANIYSKKALQEFLKIHN